MLVHGFAMMARRSELASLQLDDLRETPDGLEVLLRSSKTDKESEGVIIALPPGSAEIVCPVRVLREYRAALAAAGITTGALLRGTTKHDTPRSAGLAPKTINEIVQRAVRRAGMPNAERYSAHSLLRWRPDLVPARRSPARCRSRPRPLVPHQPGRDQVRPRRRPVAGQRDAGRPVTTECAAPTSKKTPCRAAPFATGWRWSQLGPMVDLLPSATARCWYHLPPAEQDLIRLTEENRERLIERQYEGISPACWSWELPAIRMVVGEHNAESAAWETLGRWQDGRCAICGRRNDYLVRDHDHETGFVRGLLDDRCNGREARWFGEDNLFDRYRRRPPTAILNLTIRYRDPLTGEYDEGTGPPCTGAERWTDNVLAGIGL